jgi:hypothetical protein
VLLDNIAAGHSFPSGSAQDRRMWLEIKAFDAAGTLFYSSGVVPDGQSPTVNPDADFWLVRDCMLGQDGHQVSMFWDAYNVDTVPMGTAPETYLLTAQLTNMITDPQLRYFWSHIKQYYPRDRTMHLPQLPDHVTMRVRLQPVGLDVLDDLILSNDLDPSVRAAMPTYDMDTDQSVLTPTPMLVWTRADDMNGAHIGFYEDKDAMIGPNYCVTHQPAAFVAATFVDAPKHTACTP